ncbi:MAG: ECF transporter S component [Alistipes sp.]|nr:ECF transporter S component [Alistipes sp.]
MQTSSVRLYTLQADNLKTYLAASAFVMGNILLPQLCHLIPEGGMRWLPIYFFTLVGAYKYGWRVGILTAVLSPMLNSWLTGMPAVQMLPVIECKSLMLALAAGIVAARRKSVSILSIATVVALYQTAGSLFEWAWTGSLAAALQDVRIGLPGIMLQIVGGWAVIRYVIRK